MKKTLALLLLFAMLVGIAAACSGDSGGSDSSAATEAPAAAATEAPAADPAPAGDAAPDAAPAGDAGAAPGGAPAGDAGAGPGGAPAGDAGAAPGGAPAGDPGAAPGGAPAGAPGAAPGGAPAGAPGAAPGGAPAGDPGAAPGGAPGEASADGGYIGLEAAMAQRISYELPICTTNEVYTVFEATPTNQSVYSKYDNDFAKLVGIEFDVVEVPNSTATEKLNLAIAAGTYYDIMPMSTAGFFSSTDAAVEDDVLWDFAPYIDEYMPNYSMLIHSDEEYEKAAYSDGGAIISLMSFYHVPYTSDYGPMLRQDMLEGVGMEAPVTYDDWYEVLNAVRAEYDLEATLSISQSGVARNNYFVAGYGIAGEVALSPMINVPLYVEDDTVKFGATSEGFHQYLLMMSKWYAEGLVYKDFYTNTNWSPVSDIIYNNECFAWQDDNRMIDTYQANISDPNAVVWPVADPVLEEGTKKYLKTDVRLTEGGVNLSTSLLEKDWETFLKCMDFAYSPEADLLINYGYEDEAYYIDENGDPQFTELITNNPEGYSFADAKTVYSVTSYAGGVTYNELADLTRTDAYKACSPLWDRSDGEIETMPREAALTGEESERYTVIVSDVLTYCGEMILKFILGEEDINTKWEEYVATVESLNMDEAVALQQAAYDRYINK